MVAVGVLLPPLYKCTIVRLCTAPYFCLHLKKKERKTTRLQAFLALQHTHTVSSSVQHSSDNSICLPWQEKRGKKVRSTEPLSLHTLHTVILACFSTDVLLTNCVDRETFALILHTHKTQTTLKLNFFLFLFLPWFVQWW